MHAQRGMQGEDQATVVIGAYVVELSESFAIHAIIRVTHITIIPEPRFRVGALVRGVRVRKKLQAAETYSIHTPNQQRGSDGRFKLPTELSSLCQPWGAPKRKSFCKLNRPARTHTHTYIYICVYMCSTLALRPWDSD